MLRLFAIAAVVLMLGVIGVGVGEVKLTGSQSVPHVVATLFYDLSGR